MLMLGLGLIGLQAQTMYVKQSSGAQTSYTLSDVRKVTFSSAHVTIQKSDNSIGVHALSGLKYLGFDDFTTGIEAQIHSANACLVAYPNPVNDVMNIDFLGTNPAGSISILTLDGKVILKQINACQGILQLNLSQLPRGIYLLSYANSIEIKTIKIFKQ